MNEHRCIARIAHLENEKDVKPLNSYRFSATFQNKNEIGQIDTKAYVGEPKSSLVFVYLVFFTFQHFCSCWT